MNNNGNGQCCDENTTVPQPPFSELKKRGARGRQMELFTTSNPLPAELEDPQELQTLFGELALVPFAARETKTGHALLYWYLMLAQLSPMTAACIDKIKKYTVGSKAIIQRSEDPEFETGEVRQPISQAESIRYRDALNELITFEGGIGKFHQNLMWSYEATGNAWVELSYAEVNGQFRFSLKYRKQTEVLYKITKPGEMRVAAVSPVWKAEYLRKHPPALIPLAPFFFQGDDGVFRTMFHLKAGTNAWYGRPESEGADLYKYREVQDEVYLIRQSAGNFVGQLILEIEEDDPINNPALNDAEANKAGFDSFADRMEWNFTNKGDNPTSVLVTSRPIGSRPMFAFQIKPNTNENWYKVTGEMSEQKILRAFGLTLRFMGFDVSTGFSSDTYIADYVMNVEPVLQAKRNTLMTFTNEIISMIWEIAGRQELDQYSLNFQSPIVSQIDEFKNMAINNGASNSNNIGGGRSGQPGR